MDIEVSRLKEFNGVDANAFQQMLETQLIKTNRFEVIERRKLDRTLQEKLLAMQGVTDAENVGLSGIKGVDYVVYGTITKFGVPTGGFAFGDIAVADAKIEMAADLRIADVQTGRFVFADTVNEISSGGSAFAFGGIQSQSSVADPGADAARLMAKSLTAVIAQSVYPIKVAQVQEDGIVLLNYGDAILSPKDKLKAFRAGNVIKDPDTGEILGSEETQTALLEVTESLARFSKARVIEGAVEPGSIVRKLTSAEAKASKSQGAKKGKKLG
jgi:hypothetical protein